MKGFFDSDSMEWYWGFLWALSTWGGFFVLKIFLDDYRKYKTLLQTGVNTNGVVTKKWHEMKTVDGRTERHDFMAYDFFAIPSPMHGFQQLPYLMVVDRHEVVGMWHMKIKEQDIINILYNRDEPWTNAARGSAEQGTGYCCCGIMVSTAISLIFCGIGLPLLLQGWTCTILSIIVGVIYYYGFNLFIKMACVEKEEDLLARMKEEDMKEPASEEKLLEIIGKFGGSDSQWESDFAGYNIDTSKYRSNQQV